MSCDLIPVLAVPLILNMFRLTIEEGLHVRTLHPSDAEELFQLLERNRSRLRPWIHPSALPETSVATRRFTIECFFNSLGDPLMAMEQFNDYYQELDRYFPLVNPPMEMGMWKDDRLVGEVMLSRLQDSYTAVEFGYWLDVEQEGRGIVTRCVGGLMDYAIRNMDVERFVIGCAVGNLRSRAIPERLGYRLHATIPHGEVVGEFIYDRAIYGMHSSAWLGRKNRISSN